MVSSPALPQESVDALNEIWDIIARIINALPQETVKALIARGEERLNEKSLKPDAALTIKAGTLIAKTVVKEV